MNDTTFVMLVRSTREIKFTETGPKTVIASALTQNLIEEQETQGLQHPIN